MAEQRQRQRQLGRAPSTIRVDGSVINFYNTFRALKGKTTTFEQMLPAEIENDNLENEMVELMYFCSNNPIPRAPFNAGFLPRGELTIVASTINLHNIFQRRSIDAIVNEPYCKIFK